MVVESIPKHCHVQYAENRLSPHDRSGGFAFPVRLVGETHELSHLVRVHARLMHEQGPHCPKRFTIPRKTVQGDGRGHFAKLFIVVQHAFAILVRSEHRIHTILRFGEKDISGKGKQQTSLPHIACLAVKFFDTILEHGSITQSEAFLEKTRSRRPHKGDGKVMQIERVFPYILHFIYAIVLDLGQ